MLAILTTHPIQYQVPLWQELAEEGSVPFEVWYLTDHGTKVTYDPQFGKSFAWDIDTLKGYPYRFIKVNENPKVNQFRKLWIKEDFSKLLAEKKVTALWVQGWQVLAYWQAAWITHKAGIPVWIRGESNDLKPPIGWKEPIKRFLLGQLFKRVDHFLYIGSANRRLYESYGIQAHQLHPAYYCVDNKRFIRQAQELATSREKIRAQWNIPANAFCVLFAGKFIPKKRPFDLIEAIKISTINLTTSNFHILFVGSGVLAPAIRDACDVWYDYQAPNLIRQPTSLTNKPIASLAGFLNQMEMAQAYIAADCMVLASDYGETWGLVANESMASGLPVIISNLAGSSEDLVVENQTGYRFTCGDIKELSAKLIKMESEPLHAIQMGKEAQQHIAKFSLQNVIYSIQKIANNSAKSKLENDAK